MRQRIPRIISGNFILRNLRSYDDYAILPESKVAVTIIGEYRMNPNRVKAIFHPIDPTIDKLKQWVPVLKSSLKVPTIYTPSFKLTIDEKSFGLFHFSKGEVKILLQKNVVKAIYYCTPHNWTCVKCNITI